jgi:hypothetical protein
MADKNTHYYLDALEQNYRRDAAPNMTHLTQIIRHAEFNITLETGFLTANDNYVLGKLPIDAHIIPNLSFAVGVSGTVGASLILEKVTASAGTPTALTAAAAISTDGTAVVFGAASGSTTGFPVVTASEYLQITLSAAGAVANGDVVKVIVAYMPTVCVSV